MHDESFRTLHTDISDDNEDTSSWVMLLNRDGGEDESDGIHPEMKQTETQTMDEGKPQVYSVVLIHIEFELMNAT